MQWTFDKDKANADFFLAITQLCYILRNAVTNKQRFTVSIECGTKEVEPIDPGYRRHLPDGSYKFEVVVAPLEDNPFAPSVTHVVRVPDRSEEMRP